MKWRVLTAYYKSSAWFRFVLQFLIIIAIILSIQAYKTRNVVKGPAPMIQAETLNGEMFRLDAQKGKPVLVHFWATWCPVCKFENDNVAALASKYTIITIASWSEGATEVKKFMQMENLNMPVIVDEDGEWASLYGVKAVPASFFIDKNQKISFVESGYTSELGFRLRLWWLDRLATD